jgi:hypothetical protein
MTEVDERRINCDRSRFDRTGDGQRGEVSQRFGEPGSPPTEHNEVYPRISTSLCSNGESARGSLSDQIEDSIQSVAQVRSKLFVYAGIKLRWW